VVLFFPQMDGGAGMHVIITGNMPGNRRQRVIRKQLKKNTLAGTLEKQRN